MPEGAILSIDEILAAPDLEQKTVEVPEWGGAVTIQGLTKAAQQRLRRTATTNGAIDPDKLEMLMVAHCLVDPKIDEEQAEALRNKSAAAVDRILREIMGLSGLTEEAQREALKSFRPGV